MPSSYRNLYITDVRGTATAYGSAIITPYNRDFWIRVFNGVNPPVGYRLTLSDYCVTPRTMRAADWDELSRIFGINMRGEYFRIHGEEPGPGVGPPPPYTRHYEIEPLALPG